MINISVARKPMNQSAARNVLAYGTGGINIDACRVPMSKADEESIISGGEARMKKERKPGVSLMLSVNPMPWVMPTIHPNGRFPANVLLEHLRRAWYSPKMGLPSEIKNEIARTYHGLDEALLALWQRVSGNAIAHREAEVLLTGVRWIFAEGEEKDGARAEGRIEFLESVIPSHLRQHFVLTAVEACKVVGTDGKLDKWECIHGCVIRHVDTQPGAQGNARLFRQFGGSR